MRSTASRVFLFCLSIAAGCSKPHLTSSYWETKNAGKEDLRISYFDSEHKIRYTVSNDSSSLYLYFDTDNKAVQRGILSHGATIFIDTTSKKDEKMYVRYPSESADFSRIPNMREGERNQSFQFDYKKMNKLISTIPHSIVWNNGKGEKVINCDTGKKDFGAECNVDSMSYMIFKISVPLNEIYPAGFLKMNRFSIGIKIDLAFSASNPAAEMRMGDREGRMSGGHMGGVGGRGMGGRSGMGGYNHNASQQEPVRTWFVTSICKIKMVYKI